MASSGKAIYTLLAADAAVTALVGTRIYPNTLPQVSAYPCIIYGQVDEQYLETKDAAILNGYRQQIDIYAPDYAMAQAIAQAVKTALHWTRATIEGLGTLRLKLLDASDALWEDEKQLFHVVQDFALKF